ncbi:MAG: GcvT family protein [Candidatus Promineifilaceae bacterium]
MSEKARVVIVGGGIIGAAAAYHLAKFGWKDIIMVDKGDLYHNDGSTSHAPGGVGVINHSILMTRFAKYASELYASLPEYDQPRRTYNAVGGIELARTKERWDDLHRLHSASHSFGVETTLLTPKELQEIWPIINPDVFTGAMEVPLSALVSGAGAAGALAVEAQRMSDMKVVPHTEVIDIEVVNGRVVAAITNNPEMPRIECENVLLTTNIWGPILGDKINVPLPLLAFEHQYVISEPMDTLSHIDPTDRDQEAIWPLIRDLDATMYYRQHWNRLGVGSYNHAPLGVNPYDVGKSALRPFTVSHFEEARAFADEMMPSFKGAELSEKFHFNGQWVDTQYNGMFAFSADGYPMMGETQVKGVWTCVASWVTHAGGVGKSIAEWMAFGESEWDLRACDVNRFHGFQTTRKFTSLTANCNYAEVYDIVHPRRPTTALRNARYSPFHSRHEMLTGHFTPAAGIELPNWYEENSRLLEKYEDQVPQRGSWGEQFWSPIQAAEHLEVRNNVGMYDLTALSIIEISGSGAVAYANWLCTNQMDQPVDSIIYTCWLTPKGGIKRDLAAARMADDTYWFFVGEGTLPNDLNWVRNNAPSDGSVQVRNVSDLYSAIGVWGPNARKVMEKVTDDDMSNEGFPYYSGRWIEIGVHRVYALRISYVGELGWELHVPMDQALGVWDAIWEAGREFNMIAAGQGSMDSLRVEKGYRLWGGDIYTEYNLYEAGLRWTAKFKKAGGFIGKEATLAARGKTKKRLCCITIDDPTGSVFGYEPVYADGKVIGHITTANFGYSVGKHVAFAYLYKAYAKPGTEVEVEYFTKRFKGLVSAEPLWDKSMARMKA